MTLKISENSHVRHVAKNLSDCLKTHAAGAKTFGRGQVPFKRAGVNPHMLGMCHYPQIAYGIVTFVFVFMMNKLRASQSAPKMFFHDRSMRLLSGSSTSFYNKILIWIGPKEDASARLTATKISDAPSIYWPTTGYGSAICTIKYDPDTAPSAFYPLSHMDNITAHKAGV